MELRTATTRNEASLYTADILRADEDPLLRHERTRAEARANAILARKLEESLSPTQEVLPQVDAIGSARLAVSAYERFGADSPEYSDAYEYLATDSSRYVGEVMRAKTWEYFSPLEHGWDASAGLTTFGRANRSILENGLNPTAPTEEVARRRNEYIENETHRAIVDSGVAESHWCLTISMCAHGDIDGYDHDSQKMMFRGMHFDIDNLGAFRRAASEQLGVKGHVFDDKFINEALRELGVIDDTQQLDRTDILNTQVLVPKDRFSDVIEFVQHLDDRAEGVVFMGEKTQQKGDYSSVKEQAAQRELFQRDMAAQVRDAALTFAVQGLDADIAKARLHALADRLAHQACSDNPDLAQDVFDGRTQDKYAEALVFEVSGDLEQAQELRNDAQSNAPEAMACGNGSCGLESASTAESARAHSLGLSPLDTGGYLQDKKRACKNCGRKRLIYGHNGSACIGCGTSMINGRLVIGKK